MIRLGAASLALSLFLAGPAAVSARPVDVIHPGGVPSESDTLVFDYPVLQSPSLL